MFKWFLKKNQKEKDNKGFTLVELVIVVAILAILVGLLAPQYTKYVEKSRKSSDVSNMDNLVTTFKVASADPEFEIATATYTVSMNKTQCEISITNIKSGADESTVKGKLKSALDEYIGKNVFSNDLKATTLTTKSSRWGGTNNTIKLVVTIEPTGAVTVSGHEPSLFKNYMLNGVEKSDPALQPVQGGQITTE